MRIIDISPTMALQWFRGFAKYSGHLTQCLQWLCSVNLDNKETVSSIWHGSIPLFDVVTRGSLWCRSHGPLTRYVKLCQECRERLPRHRLQRKPVVSNPGMHHGTCVTHVPWCMSESLTRGGGENVLGIPGSCATRNFTYLARGQ